MQKERLGGKGRFCLDIQISGMLQLKITLKQAAPALRRAYGGVAADNDPIAEEVCELIEAIEHELPHQGLSICAKKGGGDKTH